MFFVFFYDSLKDVSKASNIFYLNLKQFLKIRDEILFTFVRKYSNVNLSQKVSPFYYLLLFYLFLSFILRIILFFHPITQTSFTWVDTAALFTFGFLSDFFIFVLISIFLWLYLIFISNSKYFKP